MKPWTSNATKKQMGKYAMCACLACSILTNYATQVDAKDQELLVYPSIIPSAQLHSINQEEAKAKLKNAWNDVMKQAPKPKEQPKEIPTQSDAANAPVEHIIESDTTPIIEPVNQTTPTTQVVTPQPVQQPVQAPAPQPVTSPIAQRALSLVGASLWCEEVAEASIQTVGKSAWLVRTYEEGDILVEESSMGPDNFLQIATQVSLNNLQPGDLLYYANNGSGISHIAVYVGNGQAVHGGYGGAHVVLASMYLPNASIPIGLRV